jgi:hypothetical protein
LQIILCSPHDGSVPDSSQQMVPFCSSLMAVLNIDIFQYPIIKNTAYVWSQLDGLHEITCVVEMEYLHHVLQDMALTSSGSCSVMSTFLCQRCSNLAKLPFKVSWGNAVFEQQTQKNLQRTILALR